MTAVAAFVLQPQMKIFQNIGILKAMENRVKFVHGKKRKKLPLLANLYKSLFQSKTTVCRATSNFA